MKISKRGAVRSVPENSPICPYPSPPHTPLPSMCVPSICQLLDLTLSACNVRAGCARGGRGAFSAALQEEEYDAQWEASSAFKLFLLFAKCLWNNAASNAAACLARHCPLALPPPPHSTLFTTLPLSHAASNCHNARQSVAWIEWWVVAASLG